MTEFSDLSAHIESLSTSRVLCIGDLMLDRFVEGAVERISPEAPIPVIRVHSETAMLGGAGNVARNLSALGTSTHFIAVIGADAAAEDVKRLFLEEPAVTTHLLVEAGRPTSIKTRFLAANQQMLRADRECTDPIPESLEKEVLRRATAALDSCKVLVLSDYGKGMLSPRVLEGLISGARKKGRTVVADPKGLDFSRYRGASVVTPNRGELAAATRMPVSDEGEIVAAARKLIEVCGVEAVLVTRSADGMSLLRGEKGSEPEHFASESREVFDVSGAGDTVVATLSAALACGIDLSDAARLANAAAGIVIGKVGTAVVYPSDLLGALRHQDMLSGEAKIVSLAAALDRINRWRRKGRTIGFTNGCFDLLHAGHISLLDQARAACDRLVVGLNSDASVQQVKGKGRPIQGEPGRATVLASLSSVDLVVVFSEDAPLRLIEAIRPDVLVKGADYRLDGVVGADFVQGYGGRVLLADLAEGYSTSSTIAKMAK